MGNAPIMSETIPAPFPEARVFSSLKHKIRAKKLPANTKQRDPYAAKMFLHISAIGT
jgi:hypothetical protein